MKIGPVLAILGISLSALIIFRLVKFLRDDDFGSAFDITPQDPFESEESIY